MVVVEIEAEIGVVAAAAVGDVPAVAVAKMVIVVLVSVVAAVLVVVAIDFAVDGETPLLPNQSMISR